MVISSPVHPECETMLDAYLASLSSLLGQRQQNGATSGPSQEKQGLSNAAPSPKKTNRARAQHVQIIGGSTTLAPLPPLLPLAPRHGSHLSPPSSSIAHSEPSEKRASAHYGPRRLPPELTTTILLIAARTALECEHDRDPTFALDLARVDRHAHRAILSTVLLPSVTLRGPAQLSAFLRSCSTDLNDRAELARAFVKRVHVRQGAQDSSNGELDDKGKSKEKDKAHAGRDSLYDAIAHQNRFERDTATTLHRLLGICAQLECLTLEATAYALDPRRDGPSITGKFGNRTNGAHTPSNWLDALCANLTELVCLMSVYGGDLNEALWKTDARIPPTSISTPSPSPSPPPTALRWSNLTHVQLHGPRFRLTARGAIALGSLPALTHLGLIMPLLVPPEARDAQGAPRHSLVLQSLLDPARKLRVLLVVGHEMRHYVGWAEGYRPALRALRRRVAASASAGAGQEARVEAKCTQTRTRIQLVTARPRRVRCVCSDSSSNTTRSNRYAGPPSALAPAAPAVEPELDLADAENSKTYFNPHPTEISTWMLERARVGRQWDWEGEDQGRVREGVGEGARSGWGVGVGSGDEVEGQGDAEGWVALDQLDLELECECAKPKTGNTERRRQRRGHERRVEYRYEAWDVPLAPGIETPFARGDGDGVVTGRQGEVEEARNAVHEPLDADTSIDVEMELNMDVEMDSDEEDVPMGIDNLD